MVDEGSERKRKEGSVEACTSRAGDGIDENEEVVPNGNNRSELFG
jgi:hypothetical protein